MAKRKHYKRHGIGLNRSESVTPQKQYNPADPRPGGSTRALKKLSQAKDEAEIKFFLKGDEEVQSYVQKEIAEGKRAKDEAEEKARQKKNAEEAKKKPKKKKKKTPSNPHRKGRGLSIKRK